MVRRPLFPYTTLFRSPEPLLEELHVAQVLLGREVSLAVARHLGFRREAPHRLRSEEHTSELQSLTNIVCRLLLEKKNFLHAMIIVGLPFGVWHISSLV